jgi:hypothetical protein
MRFFFYSRRTVAFQLLRQQFATTKERQGGPQVFQQFGSILVAFLKIFLQIAHDDALEIEVKLGSDGDFQLSFCGFSGKINKSGCSIYSWLSGIKLKFLMSKNAPF